MIVINEIRESTEGNIHHKIYAYLQTIEISRRRYRQPWIKLRKYGHFQHSCENWSLGLVA
jgi:hypothetical protein